jgi:hypothetical protein
MQRPSWRYADIVACPFLGFMDFLLKENVVIHSEYIELIILPMCPTDGL